MKKLSLIIALALCITITGVWASWTYIQSDDVADLTGASKMITMTDVVYSGSYGEYKCDYEHLVMKVDPKEGTDHITSLLVEGNIVVTFTPTKHAPQEIVDGAVPTTVTFAISDPSIEWKYLGTDILTISSNNVVDLVWAKQADGTLTATITADQIKSIILLAEFDLDTKIEYDAYANVLNDNSITFTVSDGKTSSTVNP